MFGAMNSGAATYAKINVETGVTAASPHKLITMLFDGALVSIATATRHMQAGEIAAKGEAISRAISIIENGLIASLDKSVGGDLAQNLDSLYAYINRRLLMGNLENRPEMLDEAYKLLTDLRDAWLAIDPKSAPAPQQQPELQQVNPQQVNSQQTPVAKSPYGSLAPAPHHFVKA